MINRLFLLIWFLPAILSCSHMASSSMRIEVDVYKGPLSNTPSIQKQQLATILKTTNFAYSDMEGQLKLSKKILEEEPDKHKQSLAVYERLIPIVESILNATESGVLPNTNFLVPIENRDWIESVDTILSELYSIANSSNRYNELKNEIEILRNGWKAIASNMKDDEDAYVKAVESFVKISKQTVQQINTLHKQVSTTLNKEHIQLAGLAGRLAEQNASIKIERASLKAQQELNERSGLSKEPNTSSVLVLWDDDLGRIKSEIVKGNYLTVDKNIYSLQKLVEKELSGKLKNYLYLNGQTFTKIRESYTATLPAVALALNHQIDILASKIDIVISQHNKYSSLKKDYQEKVFEFKLPSATASETEAKQVLSDNQTYNNKTLLEALAYLQKLKDLVPENVSAGINDRIKEIGRLQGIVDTLKSSDLKTLQTGLPGSPFPDTTQVALLKKEKEGLKDKLSDLNSQVSETKSRLAVITGELTGTISYLKEQGVNASEIDTLAELETTETNLAEQGQNLKRVIQDLTLSLQNRKLKQMQRDDSAYGRIAGLASQFRVLATYVTYQLTAVEPKDKRLAIDMAKLANLSSEYANQLTSRTNALSIQTGSADEAGIDRRNLSTGQYLRDTQPTAFIELYDWFDASTGGDVKPRNRIRISQRLFDDDNWARINEVYASGMGQTSMAFIKDSIGNWNLKSFDNDPSELMAAYSKLTIGAIEKAADLASGGGTKSISQARDLLSMAQQSQTGGSDMQDQRTGQLIGSLNMQAVRETYKKRLDEVKTEIETALNKIDEDNQDEKNKIMNQGTADMKKIVNEYITLIDSLQRVAVVQTEQTQAEEN